jgi:hypothetical protein
MHWATVFPDRIPTSCWNQDLGRWLFSFQRIHQVLHLLSLSFFLTPGRPYSDDPHEVEFGLLPNRGGTRRLYKPKSLRHHE